MAEIMWEGAWGVWLTLTSLAIWVILIGAGAKVLWRRYQEETLRRLIKALLGGLAVSVCCLGIYIFIDRFAVDLHDNFPVAVAAAIFATAASGWTFHRLDRPPRHPTAQ